MLELREKLAKWISSILEEYQVNRRKKELLGKKLQPPKES